jgi:hypothetical protein
MYLFKQGEETMQRQYSAGSELESPLRHLTIKERSIPKFYRLGHSVKALEPLLLCIIGREDNEEQEHLDVFVANSCVIPERILVTYSSPFETYTT